MDLKTKKEFVQKHKKMWNEIISCLGKKQITECCITEMKKQAYMKLWPKEKTINFCFGCEWSKLNDRNNAHRAPECKKCLFDVTYKKGCLNGLYNELDDAFYIWKNDESRQNRTRLLSLAEQIRDFPVKK